MEHSPLQEIRYDYRPKLPPALALPLEEMALETSPAAPPSDELAALFPATAARPMARFAKGAGATVRDPLRVGVILSGGQAPGGHNVIAGLFDGLMKANPASKLYGFKGGPGGLVKDSCVEIDRKLVDEYRNTGGFDMIGSGRTKIETPEQLEGALATAKRRALDAVVVVGGDDSNTNAALLAEFFVSRGERVSVIGVPKTIDGDLKNEWIETSFGFDTATKTYSELVGNICRDACSARKYWHFIKLMGRSASHITLECALQCAPNVALVSEEIAAEGMSIAKVVEIVVSSIVARAEAGLDFGVVLVPEGLIEFIPEMKDLISELNDIMAANDEIASSITSGYERADYVSQKLGEKSRAVFKSLPGDIRSQLVMDRDPHGNVQVSRIDTEMLLIDLVSSRLAALSEAGKYEGKFSAQHHFFGYEGRCAFPSNFDADYCYSLGYAAFALLANRLTGYLASVRGLAGPAEEWSAGGVPLVTMMHMEKRHGEMKPVIRKALVDLKGKPFAEFSRARGTWAVETAYRYPGAIQYFGPPQACDMPTRTLALEQGHGG